MGERASADSLRWNLDLILDQRGADMADLPGGASGLLCRSARRRQRVAVRGSKGKEADRLLARIDPGVVSLAAALSRRDRLLIPACIALITLLAWAYLVHLDRQMSADMEHDKMMAAMGMTMDMPWSAADVFFTFAMWAVMMVGMMAPSASPMLMLFAAARAGRGKRGVSLATLVFGLGYIAVWTGFSVGATLAQSGLHHAAMLSPPWRPRAAGWPAPS